MAQELFAQLEQKHGLPTGLLDAVWAKESARGTKMVSPAGARGHFQFMPATAQEYGLTNPDDLTQSATAAAKMYGNLLKQYGGDLSKALAAYNWGSGNLDRKGMAQAPAETRDYIATITSKVQPKGPTMAGRDFSAELFGDAPKAPAQAAGRDFSAELFADEQPKRNALVQQGANLLGGAVRGAGSIGATILAPYDYAMDAIYGDRGKTLTSLVTGVEKPSRNQERRAAIDAGLTSLIGSDPESLAYQGGKLGAEIAGTAGVGGMLGKGVQALGATRYASGMEPIVQGLATALKTGGFRAGELAGTGAGAAARVIGGAATGGVSAGLVDPSTAGAGAVIGGALPGGAQLAGKVGNAIRGAVTGGGAAPEVAALAQRARELGIQVPADRLVDSKPLNALSASLNYVPFSGRAGTEKRMVEQLDTALSRTFGQNSSNVTQSLRRASDDLGRQFDQVLSRNAVKIDQQFMQDLAEHATRASKELGSDGEKVILSQIDELISKGQNGAIDGQAAYNIKRTLDRVGRQNTPVAYYASDLKKSLMEALNRSLGPEEAAAFANTRKQYGNMLALEKLAQNGAEGGVSVGRLANMKNIGNKDLQELADIAAQFVRPREGSHGAMQRISLGTLGAVASPFAPVAVGAGVAGGRLANMALNSNSLRDIVMRQAPTAIDAADVTAITRLLGLSAPLIPAQ